MLTGQKGSMMLNENDYGNRDARGHWTPDDKPETNPFFERKWNSEKISGFIKGYFFPWNMLFLALGWLSFYGLSFFKSDFTDFSLQWLAVLYVKNAIILIGVYGFLEVRLYVQKRQSHRFKYNSKFPGGRTSDKFAFKSQYSDNIAFTFLSGIPVWSAYEFGMMYCWANEFGLWSFAGQNLVWLSVLTLFVPLIHEFHFYCIHRLLHFPVFYRYVHSVHHRAVNPTPLSSLSMHPLEHVLYWSGCLIHLLLPSHPFIALYHLQLTGTGALVGHIGFDRIEIGKGSVKTHAFAHYLHHKYFNVNFGDGAVPFDKLFGTWHDGSPQSEREFQRKRTEAR